MPTEYGGSQGHGAIRGVTTTGNVQHCNDCEHEWPVGQSPTVVQCEPKPRPAAGFGQSVPARSKDRGPGW